VVSKKELLREHTCGIAGKPTATVDQPVAPIPRTVMAPTEIEDVMVATRVTQNGTPEGQPGYAPGRVQQPERDMPLFLPQGEEVGGIQLNVRRVPDTAQTFFSVEKEFSFAEVVLPDDPAGVETVADTYTDLFVVDLPALAWELFGVEGETLQNVGHGFGNILRHGVILSPVSGHC